MKHKLEYLDHSEVDHLENLAERIMKRFKSTRHLQRFVSIHDPIANLFHIPRHDISSGHHRELHAAAMDQWAKIARL